MGLTRFRGSVYLRTAIWGLIAVFATLTITTTEADARRRHGKSAHSSSRVVHHRAKSSRHVERYSPPYAAIVIDANSGAVLHEANADSQRHPASLTKMMTLYLLFEQLDSGKIKLDTEMDVSAHASVQAPTKLGLKPNQTLRVEDAIKALVTKSANDAAVVIAETLADDEDQFARLMTRKARALGMTHTVYRNASGLPNDEQVTTARDQAQLGRAIQDRFPKYYRYFSTPSFTYRGHAMRNHNRLLGSVEGVDGIKTGYIGASGFNLVTSVRRGNRHLVAVVLGGRTAGARDARMRQLISEHIVTASVRRTSPLVVELPENGAPGQRVRPDVRTYTTVADRLAEDGTAAAAAPTRADPVATAAISAVTDPNEELKPIPVKTVKVKASTLQTAAIGSVAVAPTTPSPAVPTTPQSPQATVTANPSPLVAPAAEPIVRASLPRTAAVETKVAAIVATPVAAPVEAEKSEPAETPTRMSSQRAVHAGWIIQVGALETVEAANQRIATARSKAMNILGRADAFTEPVVKGDKTLHRARFAVFDRDRAEAACKTLKRADIVCMAIKN
jgi:D-alanyl-D-alanine carboxypeptidase